MKTYTLSIDTEKSLSNLELGQALNRASEAANHLLWQRKDAPLNIDEQIDLTEITEIEDVAVVLFRSQ